MIYYIILYMSNVIQSTVTERHRVIAWGVGWEMPPRRCLTPVSGRDRLHLSPSPTTPSSAERGRRNGDDHAVTERTSSADCQPLHPSGPIFNLSIIEYLCVKALLSVVLSKRCFYNL